MKVEVILGDCIEVMRGMDENSVDAVVTDPPYGLEFMGKEWDRLAVPKPGNLGGFADGRKPSFERVRKHFSVMQDWHYGWAVEALRALKPGGHFLAFGGTRTHHRLIVAVEDAGFEIRDCLMWLYGSGFPKSYNLHGEWEGWGTALKPAYEHIILARKPLSEPNVAANVLKWGTGVLNIDGCRIPGQWRRGTPWRTDIRCGNFHAANDYRRIEWEPQESHPNGRWPANVLLDEEAAAMLDEQTGERRSSGVYRAKDHHNGARLRGVTGFGGRGVSAIMYDDRGGASRFFYVAKASKSERGGYNTHPTVKPIALMRYLVRLVTPPSGLVLDPFAGSGSTLIAAMQEGFRAIGIEKEPEYVEITKRRIAEEQAKLAAQPGGLFNAQPMLPDVAEVAA